MKFFLRPGLFFLMVIWGFRVNAQSYPYIIKQYDVKIKVNRDASLDVEETLHTFFNEPRHGIIRSIPYKYEIGELPSGGDTAELQLVSSGVLRTLVDKIKVEHWDYKVEESGYFKEIKIGSPDKYINDDQVFKISYTVRNAINFFKDGHSEFYYNIIGNQWDVPIEKANFVVELYKPLPDSTEWFLATGIYGSQEKDASAKWDNLQTFSGHTLITLQKGNGLTAGFKMPKDFLSQPNYKLEGIPWLLVPVAAFIFMYMRWAKYGKDEKVTVQTEFYPPEGVSPGISGYVIDNTLNLRDLTALIPYWGAAGLLSIKEIEEKSLLGLIKSKDYEFMKLKDLPVNAPKFEKTMFNGLFTKNEVLLSDLKNKFYVTMGRAKSELLAEIKSKKYYEKKSVFWGCIFVLIPFMFIFFSFQQIINGFEEHMWKIIGLISASVIMLFFNAFMTKKSRKGTELYQKLLGFKEFLKSVESDRLKEFLKQDENYFDKILPYAIVFNIADTWKDKLKGLDVPPPSWYSGHYSNGYSTGAFMKSLNNSMNSMSANFNSSPSSSGGSSGSSGGSFSSGGGGFSGGGFGGGGGSSW